MTNPVITLITALTCGAAEAGGPAVRAAAGPNSSAATGTSVSGLIVPYGVDLHPSGPFDTVRFAPGSVEAPEQISHVKLLRDHDTAAPLGVMTGFDPQQQGVNGSFRVGRHPAGVEAAGLVEDQILDGLSVGVAPLEYHDDHGTTVITRAALREVSLVAIPAASAARATVDASQSKDTPMTGTPAPAPAPVAQPAPAPAAPPVEDAALAALVEQRVTAALAALTAAAPTAPAPLPPGAVEATGGPADVNAARLHDGRIVAIERPGQYPAARGRDGRMYTAGDYFAAFALGAREGDWSQHQVIRAALADETTTEIPGLLPQQIVGELLNSTAGRRPVWDSFSARPMPMIGNKFSRPRISQHVKVDPQATEKTEIASQQYKVVLEDVAKTTLAGGLDVSQQAIDWSSPALLNQLISDFVRVYVNRTDAFAAAALKTATTGTAVVWDGTAATVTKALADAAAGVYTALGSDDDAMPNTIWLSVDTWQLLAGLTGEDGRPMFPFLGASNTSARADLSRPDAGLLDSGFRWVVSKRLAAKTFTVGDSSLVESYENGRKFLQATQPSLLGLDIAYMGYAACYAPFPKSLVPITVTPPPPAAK